MDSNFVFSSGFSSRGGYLHCEDVNVKDIHEKLSQTETYSSPFFVFSRRQLADNVFAYNEHLNHHGNHLLGYAVKANFNPSLLRTLKASGVQCAIAVGGLEVRLALDVGFQPHCIILNGNGKQQWELDFAISNGCLLNVDSAFDLENIIKSARRSRRRVKVLLRLNPAIDPKVHPYNATGISSSKFGIGENQLDKVIDLLQKSKDDIELVGLHCHLGSAIQDTSVIGDCLQFMLKKAHFFRDDLGFSDVHFINMGGGLGIDQHRHADRTSLRNTSSKQQPSPFPTPKDLIDVLMTDELKNSGLQLILEPGRSLIANTAALVTRVTGVKSNSGQNFIVVDGAMTEVIRPALYQAYHHIEPTEPSENKTSNFHIVGPVCESGDFLGKDRWLRTPSAGSGLAVFDVGAYCGSMASNYNMRMRPAEILVDGDKWKIIRKPDSYEDIIRPYTTE